MNAKTDRLRKIISVLQNSEKDSLSISDIHNGLYIKYLIDVSRKTIQRDLRELSNNGTVRESDDRNIYPAKYNLTNNYLVSIEFTLEEIKLIQNLIIHIEESERKNLFSTILDKINQLV